MSTKKIVDGQSIFDAALEAEGGIENVLSLGALEDNHSGLTYAPSENYIARFIADNQLTIATDGTAIYTGTTQDLSGGTMDVSDFYRKYEVDELLVGKSDTGHTHTFASISAKPVTLSGYGITDAYTKVQTDGKYSELEETIFSVDDDLQAKVIELREDLGTSLAGKVSTSDKADFSMIAEKMSDKWVDAYHLGVINESIANQFDALQAGKSDTGHTHTFGELTQKPVTLSGYGITDAYTKVQTDAAISGATPNLTNYYTTGQTNTLLVGKSDTGHTHTFQSITNKPTTLSGYGITDGNTGTPVTDGDKGDITVSATGATWTLKPATVRSTVLTGVDVNLPGTVLATDSVLQAAGKLQRQANANNALGRTFNIAADFAGLATTASFVFANKFTITAAPSMVRIATITYRVNAGMFRTTIADANTDISATTGNFEFTITVTFTSGQNAGVVTLPCLYA